MNLERMKRIAADLFTLAICVASIVGLSAVVHKLGIILDGEEPPALEVTIDSEHGVLCWTNTHHSGMSCLPEWMLIPGRYDSISNISSANIEGQLNGQKDPITP